MLCHVYTGTRVHESLSIDTVGIDSIVSVFAGDSAPADRFRTAIAHIRSLIKPIALLFDKVGAMLVTDGAGGTLYTAQDDLGADICPCASVAFGTEVVGIIECPLTIQVTCSV